MTDVHPTTRDLLAYIQASPTPYHCVAESVDRLKKEGFSELRQTDTWHLTEGAGYYIQRAGALVAFRLGTEPASSAGFRLLGAHSDSPNLRIKPKPEINMEGYGQLGVEIYGGALLYTWFDRDLGLAGRVVLRGASPGTVESYLISISRPIARVPSLAIHLNRDIRKDGFQINEQQHMAPLLMMHPSKDETTELETLLSTELGVSSERILSWDLCLADVLPPTVGGWNDEFIYSPRLDNQGMCHAALLALLRVSAVSATQMVCLYDHEEVGSGSTTGAAGPFVEDVMRRIAETEGPGATAGSLPRAIAPLLSGIGGHGPCAPSQLPRSARAQTHASSQRWARHQSQRPTTLRYGR